MQTFIQAWLPIGGILIILAFYLFKEWKFIFSVFCLVPYIICLIFTCFFVVETPQFLVKRFEVEEIRKNLRFIAWVNGTES
jgi:K+-transporting ATPase A subunit